MADCTVADVLTKAQSVLGDPDGEITQELVDDYGTTYGDLMACLMKISSPEVTREVYYTVPANTGVIDPSSLGVTDFGEPQQMWERGNVSSVNVTGFTDGTPITITLAASVSSAQIELNGIQGVPDWVNRDWYITPAGGNNYTLNGSVACGSAGTGGTAMFSADSFIKMFNQDVMPMAGPPVVGSVLGFWRWTNGKIYVPGANEPRQVWIEYLADDTPPASGPIGLCQGRELNFLAYGTAARFAPKRQIVMGPQIGQWAYGPSGEPDGSGGMLRELLVPIMQQQAQLPMRMGLFRRRRTQFPFIG